MDSIETENKRLREQLAVLKAEAANNENILRRAQTRDVTFVLTSDAHHARELDRVRFAVQNAERAWIEPEQVANAWPAERLAAWAEQKPVRG